MISDQRYTFDLFMEIEVLAAGIEGGVVLTRQLDLYRNTCVTSPSVSLLD